MKVPKLPRKYLNTFIFFCVFYQVCTMQVFGQAAFAFCKQYLGVGYSKPSLQPLPSSNSFYIQGASAEGSGPGGIRSPREFGVPSGFSRYVLRFPAR